MNFRKRKALALDYNSKTMSAPIIAAIGNDDLALLMYREARRYNIPIAFSDEIIKNMTDCELAHEVPEKTYAQIAKIFRKYSIE